MNHRLHATALIGFGIIWTAVVLTFVARSSYVENQSRDRYWTVFSQLGKGRREPAWNVPDQGESVDRDPVGQIPKPSQAKAVDTPIESQAFKNIKDDNIGTRIPGYQILSIFGDKAVLLGPQGVVVARQDLNIPEAGKVNGLKNKDGIWVLVTTKGFILPSFR